MTCPRSPTDVDAVPAGAPRGAPAAFRVPVYGLLFLVNSIPMRRASTAIDAYCPHCGLPVEQETGPSWPRAPVRCPHCRLLIGVGRARAEPSGEPGTKGAAAGVLSRQARRDDTPDAVTVQEVLAAIRQVADELGTRPERLLMVDYQQHADSDDDLPPLRDVFAHFKSWKRARRVAADGYTP